MSTTRPSERPTITIRHDERETEAADLVGAWIGDRYQLLQVLGTGGQAWVFQARDDENSRFVALKLLRPEFRCDDTALRRFKREREELARLPHPNVVAVYSHGVDTPLGPWMTMEHLTGETLATELGRGVVRSALDAVTILLPLLEPIAVLHAQGGAHRDLKPSNIFLARKDEIVRPVLLDFGMCFRPTNASGAERLTQDGEAVGTLGYLAPEALYSTPTRVALLDVWAIAAILVEIVMGARLVPREQSTAPVLRSADEWEEHLVEFGSRTDERLRRIVAESLSVDLVDRPADATALCAELRGWLAHTTNRA